MKNWMKTATACEFFYSGMGKVQDNLRGDNLHQHPCFFKSYFLRLLSEVESQTSRIIYSLFCQLSYSANVNTAVNKTHIV